MGQVQSEAAAAAVDSLGEQLSPAVTPQSDSHAAAAATSSINLDSLIAEAAAYGNDENESLEAKAQKALECPCIADLRNGQCGFQFSEAFLCFLKSTTEEKGSDCVHPFVALQKCIKAYPDAFSKDILEEDEVKKEEKPTEEYKIRPPLWAKKSKT
ncbi:mitochondrial intermembrane space import and assembly protein 40 homolog isoform X2 [Quercus suber]|uniref:Mitochondrial intermembrane space import and assembly protein 40 homolog n=1 Tax=Quercus suber TaxID=58331 RepID=A0AAW0J6U9_QUESU|nr:mitochondrial intermembrane space import and assembly protein 40 homolog isoform X1 [Quercus suber]POE89364.1 mitochondrial intermembrane space import and assembly protein 40 like [Quercus suber]